MTIENTALAIKTGDSLKIQTPNDLERVAKVFMDSGAFTDTKSVALAQVKIMAGLEKGIGPFASMTGVHFFLGKPVIGAQLLAGLVKQSGKYEYKVLEHTEKRCSVQFMQKFNGKFEKLGVPVTYSLEDARLAKLDGKDNWKMHPKDMLMATCLRKGSRWYCPDVINGMLPTDDAEQAFEFDSGIDIQPSQTPQNGNGGGVIDAEIVEESASSEIREDAKRLELVEAIQSQVAGISSDEREAVEGTIKGMDLSRKSIEELNEILNTLIAT